MKALFLILLFLQVLPIEYTSERLSSDEGKPRLDITASPRVSSAGPGDPSRVTVHAWLRGEETEEFYCPKVTFRLQTDSVEESDCAPFVYRNVCWPMVPVGCLGGFHRDKVTGEWVNDPPMETPECACNVTGYPRHWSRVYGIGKCPYETTGQDATGCRYEVKVILEKNGKRLQDFTTFEVR
jgi:hypothetical protein